MVAFVAELTLYGFWVVSGRFAELGRLLEKLGAPGCSAFAKCDDLSKCPRPNCGRICCRIRAGWNRGLLTGGLPNWGEFWRRLARRGVALSRSATRWGTPFRAERGDGEPIGWAGRRASSIGRTVGLLRFWQSSKVLVEPAFEDGDGGAEVVAERHY